jgi:hypothetical protein
VLARLLRETKAGILLNERIAENGPTVFAHARLLGAEGIVSKRGTVPIDPARRLVDPRLSFHVKGGKRNGAIDAIRFHREGRSRVKLIGQHPFNQYPSLPAALRLGAQRGI